jgi:hypothetical protein
VSDDLDARQSESEVAYLFVTGCHRSPELMRPADAILFSYL